MPQILYTRDQCLNRECTHSQYYGQFINNRVERVIKLNLSTGQFNYLRQSQEEYFNDCYKYVPMWKWNSLGRMIKPFTIDMVELAGDIYTDETTGLCIAKECVRVMLGLPVHFNESSQKES